MTRQKQIKLILERMEMNIKATKTTDNKIDVRDSAGIRLMLLNEKENKGLYTYFEIRMAQAEESRTSAERTMTRQNQNTMKTAEEFVKEYYQLPKSGSKTVRIKSLIKCLERYTEVVNQYKKQIL